MGYNKYKKQRLKENKNSNYDVQLYIHKDKTISLRLNGLVLGALKRHCKSRQISVNEIINQLIRQELNRNNIKIKPELSLVYGKDWEL